MILVLLIGHEISTHRKYLLWQADKMTDRNSICLMVRREYLGTATVQALQALDHEENLHIKITQGHTETITLIKKYQYYLTGCQHK